MTAIFTTAVQPRHKLVSVQTILFISVSNELSMDSGREVGDRVAVDDWAVRLTCAELLM